MAITNLNTIKILELVPNIWSHSQSARSQLPARLRHCSEFSDKVNLYLFSSGTHVSPYVIVAHFRHSRI